MSSIFNQIMLKRTLAILLIYFGFYFSTFSQFIFGKLVNIAVMSIFISPASLAITLILLISGVRLFDSTFYDNLIRPKGAVVIALFYLWQSTRLFNDPFKYNCQVFSLNLEYVGIVAFIILFFWFVIESIIGIGFLRLKLAAWFMCVFLEILDVTDFIFTEYTRLIQNKINILDFFIFNKDPILQEVTWKLERLNVVFIFLLYVFYIRYLFAIKHSFKK